MIKIKQDSLRVIVISISVFALASALLFVAFHSKEYMGLKEKIMHTISSSSSLPFSHSTSPVISNQWYSSLFTANPPQPLFAMPLAFKVTPQGLSFSYPTPVGTKDTIYAPFIEDFTLGFLHSVAKPKIESVGDWNIHLSLTSNQQETMSFVLGHGIPFTVVHTKDSDLILTFPTGYNLFDENKQEIALNTTRTMEKFVVSTNNHNYILVFPKKILVHLGKNQLQLTSSQRVFIGLLDSREHFSLFASSATTEIKTTHITPTNTDNSVKTTYQVVTNDTLPLLALYPHQYDYLSEKMPVVGSYQTLRGTLKLFKTRLFTTTIPLTIPDTSFVPVKDNKELILQIKADITDLMHKGPPASEDYFLGTWFGKISNLLQLADTFGMKQEKQQLLSFVEPLYINSLHKFKYNKQKTSLIAMKPEFGNENLNDHHFHYGYFIRTGAVLAMLDPTIIPKIKTSVDNFVSDIATINRLNNAYPFLRNFDSYEAHSWADGFANFADGNNQESISEAINAWYGVYLWSKVTHNTPLTTYALYLYNTEILGAKYYWFDLHHIYTLPYEHSLASIVWGGKIDFATWFSAKANMKYGIELLPFSPASTYFGTFTTFSSYESDLTRNGGGILSEWGDLILMWKSFYDPHEAIKYKDDIKIFQEDNTKSMLLYFLYRNLENTSKSR